LHSSKNLEFKYVIVFGLEHGRIPWLNVNEDKINESRRLFYVGLTRAKDETHLYIQNGIMITMIDIKNFVVELKEIVENNL
jgi:DNA helicase-2/ATP-dependent DNA helicase PcrA